MKTFKKIFSIIVVVAIAVSLVSIPATANTEDVEASAWLVGNGNNARLTISINGNELSGLTWSNNSSRVYTVGDYEVEVFIRGGAATVQSVTYIGSVEASDSVAPDMPEVELALVDDVVLRTAIVQNAGFHCNAHGGNGRVRPIYYYDANGLNGQHNDIAIGLVEIPGTTAWEFVSYARWQNDLTFDALTDAADKFECPVCGSTEWVSYSNNSGVPDGKNIQLNHSETLPTPEPEEPGPVSFSVLKTLDGKSISEWYRFEEARNDMRFYAYPISEVGANLEGITPYPGELNDDGTISFSIPNPQTGWFAILEELNGEATSLFIAPSIQYFFVVFGEDGIAASVTGAPVNIGTGEVGSDFIPAYAIEAWNYSLNEDLHRRGPSGEVLRINTDPDGLGPFGVPDIPNRSVSDINLRMLSLRFFNNVGLGTADIDSADPENGITFGFGADIFNNPGDAADITVYEITFDSDWYTEAADLYLIDAVMSDGSVVDKLFVGTLRARFTNPTSGAITHIGEDGNPETGFRFEVVRTNLTTATNVWLPDDVVKASAIRLADVSDRFNIPERSHINWNLNRGGFDIDAIAAWFTGGDAQFVNVLISND